MEDTKKPLPWEEVVLTSFLMNKNLTRFLMKKILIKHKTAISMQNSKSTLSLLLVSFSIILISCNKQKGRDQEIIELQKIDSPKHTFSKQDSISASYIWGNIKFGISINEALATDMFKGVPCDRSIQKGTGDIKFLGEPKKFLNSLNMDDHTSMTLKFDHNRLLSLSIENSAFAELVNPERIKSDADKLVKQIEKKYGKAGIEQIDGNELYIWGVANKKSIALQVILQPNNTRYELTISHADFCPLKSDVDVKMQTEEEKAKQDADNQKVLDNSF